MKKTALALTFILMLSVSLLYGLSTRSVEADATATIYIRDDGSVEGTDQIQRDGDNYILKSSITGSIVVERDNIVIDGAGYFLTPGNDATVGIDIRDRNNVTIKNLAVRGFIGRCALLLINNDYCTIQNNTFSSNLNGIEMTLQSSHNKIVENNFENNELGLELYSIDPGSNNIISENNIKNNTFGMVIRNFTYTHILNNKFEANNYGLFVGVGSGTKLENNVFSDNAYAFGASNTEGASIDTTNTVNGKPIYHWVNQHDKTVPEDAGYVALIGCSGITVQNLDLSGNYHGVFLGSTINSTVVGNKFHGNLYGVSLDASVENTIKQNLIVGNENGVGLEAGSSENSVFENRIEANGFGVFIDESSGNSITGNIIRDSEAGVYTQYSNLNNLHHNNFVNNSKNWDDTGLAPFWFGPPVSVNAWDDDNEGNYWSDYNGADADGNGVSDVPYVLGTNNTDRYPLMNPVVIPEFPDGSGETEPFPATLFLVGSVGTAITFIGVLVYLKKRQSKTGDKT